MDIQLILNYGDVVRLKRNFIDFQLKKGDCGIVWAVYQCLDEENRIYDSDYEATFWNQEGKDSDLNFEKEDVEKIEKIEEVPFSQEMKEFWAYINQN